MGLGLADLDELAPHKVSEGGVLVDGDESVRGDSGSRRNREAGDGRQTVEDGGDNCGRGGERGEEVAHGANVWDGSEREHSTKTRQQEGSKKRQLALERNERARVGEATCDAVIG